MSLRDAYFFDSSNGKRLFATATRPESKTRYPFGVVFCHSFGEERQKSYRSTFLFAERLADAGIPSFRFDYTGIGDSEGSLLDTNIDRMVADTVMAFGEARKHLCVGSVVPIGIRFGAPVAMRAMTAANLSAPCALWNPVIEGFRYYRELMRTEMIIALARKGDDESINEPLRPPGTTEIDADLVSDEAVEKMKAIKLVEEPIAASALLITARENDKPEVKLGTALHEKALANDTASTLWTGESHEFWSARSMHDAFFPEATFETTLRWLEQQVQHGE